MGLFTRCQFQPNDFSNYRVSGNLTNAFAIGVVGSSTDFWMVGAPAADEDAYPVITGNFLDSQGKPLFRLVKNVLHVNPRDCAKILGQHIGFKIHDGEDNHIIKVETKFYEDMGRAGMYVTDIEGTFYNAKGERVAWTDESGGLALNCPALMGFSVVSGGWAYNQGNDEERVQVATYSVATHGAIHEVVKGRVSGETIQMDGKVFLKAEIDKCVLVSDRGDFFLVEAKITHSTFRFTGAALRAAQIARRLP